MEKSVARARAEKAKVALALLRAARDLLKEAKAPRATEKVRLAIKSTEGAARRLDTKAVVADIRS